MFFFDPLYLMLALPGILLTLWAQWKVNSTYNNFARVANSRGLTGVQAADILIRQVGLQGQVQVQGTPGKLSDHYDPRNRTLFLSVEVAKNPSIAAVGITAHELGHALQHAQNYGPLNLRMAIVPIVNLGSRLGYIVFFLGLCLATQMGANPIIMWIGILLLSSMALFALVTLPVEFDASRRAMQMLQTSGLMQAPELQGAQKVLNAAAWTYVAAAASAILNLLYFVALANRASRR
ncbi:MAG: zinc metallopeptidase [Chloroflexota bacterium]|nr:MAG: zinc metallopeptidase [Chloroflexota bacterium]